MSLFTVSFPRFARVCGMLLAAFLIQSGYAQQAIPYEQNFPAASFPVGWTVQYTGITATIWSVVSGNSAGGFGNEAKAQPAYQSGISRLVMPAFNTTALSELRLSFRQQLSVFDRFGLCFKVQSSADGTNWTDEEFVHSVRQGSIAAEYKSMIIRHNLGDTTWLAFVLEGKHDDFIGWKIDDIYVGNFTAQANCPTNQSPNYNQTNVPVIGALSWKTGLYSMGNTLFFGTDNPPTNIVNGIDLGLQQRYDYPPLQPNTQYRYKVLTYNDNGVKPFCSNVVFTTVPTVSLPFSDSFPTISLASSWVQQTAITEGFTTILWYLSSGWNYAGGTTSELTHFYQDATGMSRIITPPLNTTGLSEIALKLNHKIKSLIPGLNLKIQSSADGVTWTDEQIWSTDNGDVGPEPFTLAIHHNLGNYTFISFTIEGDMKAFYGWYIDNIVISNVSGVPGCVSQISPADSATGVLPGVDFSWNPVPAASGYKLYLGTDNPPTTIHNGLDVGNIHKIKVAGLQPGQNYHWRIVPYNQSGLASGCPVRVFTMMPAQPVPFAEDFMSQQLPTGWLPQWSGFLTGTIWKTKPISGPLAPYILAAISENQDGNGLSRLVFPPLTTDSAYNLKLAFKFLFLSVDTAATIKIQSSPDCLNWTDLDWSLTTAAGYNSTTYELAQVLTPAFTGATTYLSFLVEGDIDDLNVLYIDSIRLTPVYYRPPCNTLVRPAHQATDIDLNTSLAWVRNTLALGYHLYLGTDYPPTNILNGLNVGSDTLWRGMVFNPTTTYYWKVVPYNAAGNAILCPIWSFSTSAPFPLPLSESFNSTVFPAHWKMEQFGENTIWSHVHWGPVGSVVGYMQADMFPETYFLNQGTTRLITPPLNTTGLSMLNLRFIHTYEDFGNGVTIKIQTSSDGLNWSDESWYFHGGNGDLDNDTVTVMLGQHVGNITFVSFTIEGGLGAFHQWKLDDILITAGTGIPSCIGTLYPPDDMIGAAEVLKLSWEMNPMATSYSLYVGTDYPPTNVLNNFSTGTHNEYRLGTLQQETQYYWKVVPHTPFGSPAGCAIQSFTVTDTKDLPYTNNFDESYFPAGWRQEHSGEGVLQDIWGVADTNLAGGNKPEIKAVGYNDAGISRLISPPLNTENYEYITLTCKHLYKKDFYNAEMILQSSTDGINWTNEEVLFIGGMNMTYPATISVKVTQNLGAKTYLAFTVIGNHNAIKTWQIDNISILPQIDNEPEIFSISAPSYICQGSPPVPVTLSGSQLNAEYRFFQGTTQVGPVVAGTGQPLIWPDQPAGTYHVLAKYHGEIAQMTGGKFIANAPLPIPDAGPDININAGQTAQLECIVSSGAPPYNYLWSPAASLNDPTLPNPLASPLSTTLYTVSVADSKNCGNSDTVSVTVLAGGFIINGTLSYHNSILSPLTNCQVNLMQNGIQVQTSTTDAAGAFSFSGLSPGNYSFTVSIPKAWGGGNSVDALLIMQHFVGMATLSGLPLLAGDVINPGAINSVDALTVMKRFVGMITSFPVGDWIVENQSLTITDSNISMQLKAICTGDVNTSFIPSP